MGYVIVLCLSLCSELYHSHVPFSTECYVGEVKSHFHESERHKELNGQKIRPEMSIKRGTEEEIT